MSHNRRRSLIHTAAGAALLTSLFVCPFPAVAQGTAGGGGSVRSDDDAPNRRWFPHGTIFAPLIAAPREVALRGSLIMADRTEVSDYGKMHAEAEAGFGYRTNVVRLRDASEGELAADLGFEVGIFSRFYLEAVRRDLIHADYRVGTPLSFAYREWEGRFTLLHISSHLGDDYMRRFELTTTRTAQDGFELIVARRVGQSVRLYGGGYAHFHVSGGASKRGGYLGLELDPEPAGNGTAVWPFVAGHLGALREEDNPAFTGAAGVAVRLGEIVMRWEVRGHSGPSPMGQRYKETESFLGIGLSITPSSW